jgi:HEAT repeat protein
VIEALGDIGDERTVAPLVAMLESAEMPVRYSINEALKKLGHFPPDFDSYEQNL